MNHTCGGEDQAEEAEKEHRRSRSPERSRGDGAGGASNGYGKRTEEQEGDTEAPTMEGTEADKPENGADSDQGRKVCDDPEKGADTDKERKAFV